MLQSWPPPHSIVWTVLSDFNYVLALVAQRSKHSCFKTVAMRAVVADHQGSVFDDDVSDVKVFEDFSQDIADKGIGDVVDGVFGIGFVIVVGDALLEYDTQRSVFLDPVKLNRKLHIRHCNCRHGLPPGWIDDKVRR